MVGEDQYVRRRRLEEELDLGESPGEGLYVFSCKHMYFHMYNVFSYVPSLEFESI